MLTHVHDCLEKLDRRRKKFQLSNKTYESSTQELIDLADAVSQAVEHVSEEIRKKRSEASNRDTKSGESLNSASQNGETTYLGIQPHEESRTVRRRGYSETAMLTKKEWTVFKKLFDRKGEKLIKERLDASYDMVYLLRQKLHPLGLTIPNNADQRGYALVSA